MKWFLKSFVTRLCIGLIALLIVFLLSILAGIETGKLEIIPPAGPTGQDYLSLLRNSPIFTVEGFEQMCLILLLAFGILLVSFVIVIQYSDNQTHTATD